MSQRINDYQALYKAASDLESVGENVMFQLNFLISEGESLGTSWRDPQYQSFMDRLIEYREQITVYRQRNEATIDAVNATAKKIVDYLNATGGR
jgi:hypothetical protein